jgi:DNA-binding NarL/FixJ family response regulator
MLSMPATTLDRARSAFGRKEWKEAAEAFAAAAGEAPPELDDIECHAVAALLTGANRESYDLLALGYREALRRGAAIRAARFAFWVGHALLFDGAMSESLGWMARARQLLASTDVDCPERGYVLIPEAVMIIDSDSQRAYELFREASEIGARLGDANLVAMAGHGMGRSLIRLGRMKEGMSVLDTVMVGVISDEVSPMVVGDVYCGVLEACHEVFDIRRAREWTGALTRWCEGQPDLVPHRGPCMVYRAELFQFHGSWSDALEEATRACEWLSGPLSPEGAADAFYRIGELHRLQGSYAEAEEAYRQASRQGRPPEPGLPLLWLARGQVDAASAAIRRALSETTEPPKRAPLLDADVQVCLALGRVDEARASAEALADLAAPFDSPYLRALAARTEGTVLLAEGRATESLAALRRAWSEWQSLEAPYEAAQVRALIGAAYRQLGDGESAAMEFDAARRVFQELHALPDLARLDAIVAPQEPARLPGGLTLRELDVLRLVAAGDTNKQIAAALVISEHTVARHIQNMLAKLGCASRAALAAFAVEHELAGP